MGTRLLCTKKTIRDSIRKERKSWKSRIIPIFAASKIQLFRSLCYDGVRYLGMKKNICRVFFCNAESFFSRNISPLSCATSPPSGNGRSAIARGRLPVIRCHRNGECPRVRQSFLNDFCRAVFFHSPMLEEPAPVCEKNIGMYEGKDRKSVPTRGSLDFPVKISFPSTGTTR
jgi:hypothetical protein